MNRYKTIALALITLVTLGVQAQNQKPDRKPVPQKPAKPAAAMPNIESILSMTDTASYAAIKQIDEQIKQTDQKIAQLKATQKSPSLDLTLESREKELLKNETELYQLYSEREKLVLKKKELRRKSMKQTLMSKPADN